jgi:LacI family transcriptional regulator
VTAGSPKDRVTIIEIAAAAGVSKSTVSLVLKGSESVRPSTRDRVNAAIRDLGYVYNRGAANLRRAHSNMVGMIIHDLINPFCAELAVGIERSFQAAGYVPFIANTAESPVRQAEVIKLMREQGVAGLIVMAARGTPDDALDGLVAAGVPVVLAMRRLKGRHIPVVGPDNRLGARLAVERLVGLGHRRIAFLGGHADSVVRGERLEGFRAALADAGLDAANAVTAATAPTRDGGAQALNAVLAQPDPPTAAVCFNDIVAFGVCLGLRRRGIEPGRGFAVIGFDDVQEAAHADPPLTTIAVDVMGLGERAAQSVLRMIETGRNTTEDHIGAVHLAVRESCGGPMVDREPERTERRA